MIRFYKGSIRIPAHCQKTVFMSTLNGLDTCMPSCYVWPETDTTDGVRSETYLRQSEPRLSINGIPEFWL